MCYSLGMHSTDLKEMKVNLMMLGFQGIQISMTKNKHQKMIFFPKTERKKEDNSYQMRLCGGLGG